MQYVTILVGVLVAIGYGASVVGLAAWAIDLLAGNTHLVDWRLYDGWGHLVLVLAGAVWLARQIWLGQLGR